MRYISRPKYPSTANEPMMTTVRLNHNRLYCMKMPPLLGRGCLLDCPVQAHNQRVDILAAASASRLLNGVCSAATEVHFVIAKHRDRLWPTDRKSTRLNSSHLGISYA